MSTIGRSEFLLEQIYRMKNKMFEDINNMYSHQGNIDDKIFDKFTDYWSIIYLYITRSNINKKYKKELQEIRNDIMDFFQNLNFKNMDSIQETIYNY